MDEEATAAVATGTGAKSSSSKGGGIMGRSAKIFTRRSLYVDVQSVRPPSPASGGAVNMAASGGHYRTRAATTKAAMTTANGDGDGAGGTNNPVPVFMPADHRLKVLVVGDPGAGRTALVNNLSLPPHLSSPLQRLSSFLGSKSGSSRDRQPDGQKTTTTVQLSHGTRRDARWLTGGAS
ncbi:uncharacterized protein ACA1_389000 [Acanthamoeba castellanii str. Neff]|uniref:Uncharacterized protein n=1 Tax=Acanthamoeba castellanii (strain ATCC 30010 / Neff) TaxID=1257118 RepID=L8GEB5_ACACF|nr:uncharacterized protein ACA1_389000 [Acanthamoeba castellanii str. Neff]ELR11189.1 hypothetical protein ACA1_389000 [Acanthamoeba castellanii str. Neff]